MSTMGSSGIRYRTRLTAIGAGLAAVTLNSCALEDSGVGDDTTAADTNRESGSEREITTVKVGYLHTVAVDAHLWLGEVEGIWERNGVKLQPVRFDTGVALSQALSGGSVDVAVMGAVISNFPALGGSKIFLVNDVEYDTAQLWAHPEQGIASVKDLAGKRILTTHGTTAHVYLHTALKANGVDPGTVKVVNASMPAAVSGFIAKAAPAVVLWVPFDNNVKENAPSAKLIDSAKSYYPDAAILGGWITSDTFHSEHRDVLVKIAAGWLETNDLLVNDTDASLKKVHEKAYADTQELADTERQFSSEKVFTNEEWLEKYNSGEVARWIGQVERVFVEVGGLPAYTEPTEFLDTTIFTDAIRQRKGAGQ